MKQIVCLGAEPWTKFMTRTEQLLVRIDNAEILYFEPPLYLPASTKKKRATHSSRNRYSKKPRERMIRNNIYACPLPPIWPTTKLTSAANTRTMVRHIRSRMGAHGFHNVALWVASPFYADVARELDVFCTLYDFSGRYSYPARMHQSLVQYADVILAATPFLANELKNLKEVETLNMALIPDGADCKLYAQAGENAAAFPHELFNVSGPILGSTGTLTSRTNYAPLIHAASLRQDWTFVLTGHWNDNVVPNTLHRMSNVLVLPCRSSSQVAEYAAHFDLFFQLNTSGAAVPDLIPSSVLEALYTGKPMVLVTEPHQPALLSEFTIPVRSNSEFAAACRKALADPGDHISEDRRHFAQVFDWRRIASEVSRILEANGVV